MRMDVYFITLKRIQDHCKGEPMLINRFYFSQINYCFVRKALGICQTGSSAKKDTFQSIVIRENRVKKMRPTKQPSQIQRGCSILASSGKQIGKIPLKATATRGSRWEQGTEWLHGKFTLPRLGQISRKKMCASLCLWR